MRRTLLLTAAFSFVWLGCHKSQPAAVLVDAGPQVVDAGPPAPHELTLTLRYPDADGGTETLPLEAGETPTLPPVQKLEILTNEPLQNGRIRVFDEANRLMASDEQIDASDAGIRDQITFQKPLLGGHKYLVVVDAQNPGNVLDPQGNVVPEKRLDFQISGEREAPPPPPKKKPSRRHHHRRHHR